MTYDDLCQQVFLRDRFKCRNCGYRQNLHVHHIIFRSNQGPDELWNLVTVCNSCHDGIHKDVKDGEFGLVIETPADANGGLVFIRASWWIPK